MYSNDYRLQLLLFTVFLIAILTTLNHNHKPGCGSSMKYFCLLNFDLEPKSIGKFLELIVENDVSTSNSEESLNRSQTSLMSKTTSVKHKNDSVVLPKGE